MKNKENVSDSDSNSSSSWIFINKERITSREEIENVELLEENSESESDGISVISESDALNEEKCMETYDDYMKEVKDTYDDFINEIKASEDNKCNAVECTKEHPFQFEGMGFWGMLSCIICACLCVFATIQGGDYLKNIELENRILDIVIDSTFGCMETLQVHKIHYNKSDVRECVQTVYKDTRYGRSVEEALKQINFSKTKAILLNVETEENLGKKCKNPIKKSQCKKKSSIKNNENNKDKETKTVKATSKFKAKKGSGKKNKNKEIVTGEWYLDLHKARNNKRSREHAGDWVFDRANIRKNKRNSAMWYFSYMKMRENYRFEPLKKENL